MSSIPGQPKCGTCGKAPPEIPSLKFCQKCNTARYCSRDCQKKDWKQHKKTCAQDHAKSTPSGGQSSRVGGLDVHSYNTSTAGTRVSPPKGVDKGVARPFTRLRNKTFLHDRSEQDVFRLLIDTHRLRVDDEHKFRGDGAAGSIYDGTSKDSLPSFRRFLTRAEKQGVMPPWWDAAKRQECETFAMSDQWCNLRSPAGKSDISDHYGDGQFPMQLRVFAEPIYGSPLVPGQSAMSVVTTLASMEG